MISQVSLDPDTNAPKEEIAVAPDRLSDAFSVYQKELNKQKTNDKKDLNKKKTNGIKYRKIQKARYVDNIPILRWLIHSCIHIH